MKDKETSVPGKKFLYSEAKKAKEGEGDRQFYSRGYHPSAKSSLIDLDSVWSVKDVILEGSAKPIPSDRVTASTSYYSRYGQYKNSQDKAPVTSVDSPSQWNKNTVDTSNAANKKLYRNDSSSNHFDF